MTVYVVTGRLGGGKTLVSVGRIVEYLERGLPVATNLDLDLAKLPRHVKGPRIVRLPDAPTADDLQLLGCANESRDESKNGLLVLDEAGVIFNAREWGDKGRQAVIAWLLHSRKLGWDVLLIVQALNLLDKQMRESLCEMHVICRRLDRVKIPLISGLIELLSLGWLSGRMPRIHIAAVKYGLGPGSAHADTWVYRGSELFDLYDTRQRFRQERESGPYSMVDVRQWATGGGSRSGPPPKPKLPHVARLMRLAPDARVHVARRWEARGLLAPV